jgi:hypothetical protein
MKRIRSALMLLLVPLLFAGCETVNQQDRAVLRAHNVPGDVFDKMLYGDPLSVDDVIVLSQRGVPNGLIVHYLDETDVVYRLSKAEVKRLRAAGVSERVIGFMLSTGPGGGPIVYRGGYPYGGPYGYGDPYGAYGPYYGPYDYYGYPYWGGPLFIGGYGRFHGGRDFHGHGGHHR